MITSIKNKSKAFFSYIWTNKKRPKVWIPAIIVIIILISIMKPSGASATYEILKIEPQEFVQEVSVTGKVVPAQKVDLGFEYSGRLSKVNTTVGSVVKKGQVLASLNNADYYAGLQKSQAAYASEQAKLADIQKGNRPESIAIAKADVEVAMQNVAQAKLAISEEIRDSYAIADDGVRNKGDKLFRNARSVSPELTFFVDGNANLKTSLEYQRLRLGETFPAWLSLVSSQTPDKLNEEEIKKARDFLSIVQTFLNDLNSAASSVNISLEADAAFQGYRADINLARTNVNASIQAFDSALTGLKNSESALARANQALALELSGSTPEEIKAAQANALGAAASVSSAAASLSKTVITAPFDGIVTRVQYKTGESVNSAEPVITLMSDASFEIETFVSENDVPKLKIGQLAKVTLDALGDAVVFDATVSQVDLSETIKDGVVTYLTRLQFNSRDERIKSGLTTNVTVETDKRSGVIKVPQTGIIISKGKKNVKVAPPGTIAWDKEIDGKSSLVAVTTGAIDRDGDLEVLSGLKVGDIIIVKTPAPATE